MPRAVAHKVDKSIAVLPFENLSDDQANAYFADGVQDDVLTNLSKIGDLKVISRTSVMQYRGRPTNVREIGKTLGVSNILEGSVRRSGNRVRVNVQLIDANTDEHLLGKRLRPRCHGCFCDPKRSRPKHRPSAASEVIPRRKIADDAKAN